MLKKKKKGFNVFELLILQATSPSLSKQQIVYTRGPV